MSAKSKRPAEGIDRPFDPALLAQAKQIAQQYQVILSWEDGHWYGRGLELPNIYGDGKTANECVENTREAFSGSVAYLLEQGQKAPAAARERDARTQQVNIRLTAEEKLMLETAAKRKGYKGLAAFVRAAAVESAR